LVNEIDCLVVSNLGALTLDKKVGQRLKMTEILIAKMTEIIVAT
jgi:hypothetical protein